MKAEVQADRGTICDKAYCVLEIAGYTFRLSSSDYNRLNHCKEDFHTHSMHFFQMIADRINNDSKSKMEFPTKQ